MRIPLSILTLFISIILSIEGLAQEDFGRKIVQELSNSDFYGRGYTNEGDWKAAQYIKNQFINLGVDSFLKKSYFQSFPISVNTFPNRNFIRLGKDTLKGGLQYILDPSSGKEEGKYDLLQLEKKYVLNSKKFFKFISKNKGSGKVIIIDQDGYKSSEEKELLNNTLMTIKQYEGFNFKAILLLTSNKLTWSISDRRTSIPIIKVKKEDTLNWKDSIEFKISNKYYDAIYTQNVIGFLPGTTYPDSFIIIGAHYDHLGQMGNVIFPGANDNATGVSMMLNLAKHFSPLEDRLPYSLLFIAFSAEELGLAGSKYFCQRPIIPLNNIKLMMNLDLIGSGDEGLAIVNGKSYLNDCQFFIDLKDHYQIPRIKVRPNSANSDHYFFAKKGIKSLFFYTMGGTKAYHDPNDIYSGVTFSRYNEVFQLLSLYLKQIN